MAFIAAFNKGVKWTPSAGAQASLNVTEHSWAEMIDAIDVTHSGSGGVQALLASILRGEGNVSAFSDDAQVISNAAINIIGGASGVMLFYHYAAAGNPFTVPAMIIKVNWKTPIANGCQYNFDVKLNSIAGTYARPS